MPYWLSYCVFIYFSLFLFFGRIIFDFQTKGQAQTKYKRLTWTTSILASTNAMGQNIKLRTRTTRKRALIQKETKKQKAKNSKPSVARITLIRQRNAIMAEGDPPPTASSTNAREVNKGKRGDQLQSFTIANEQQRSFNYQS